MSNIYTNSPTQKISVDGTIFTYRKTGNAEGVPLVLLNHLTGTLDNWDPRVVDGLAKEYTVITFNNKGVGSSGGKVPFAIEEMATDAINFIKALGYEKVNLLGFSLGGMIAQYVIHQSPQLVNNLILAGTGPAGGVGIENVTKLTLLDVLHAAVTFNDPKVFLFFTRTNNGKKSAKAFLGRLKERTQNRDAAITIPAFRRQLKAIYRYGMQKPVDLSYITQPTLVANGDDDRMVPTSNTEDLAKRIKNSRLEIYADAGHAGIFQYHDVFVKTALDFLYTNRKRS
jgi:pimeloyl-ACP methyl ester carboxylesterase